MKTTTRESTYIPCEENLLYNTNGEVNQEVYSRLNKIISNVARSYASKNLTTTAEDLEQDAWVKIFETIKSKKEDRFRDIKYLVVVAKNEIIGKCMGISKDRGYIDDFSSMLLSSSDSSGSEGSVARNHLNVAKSRLEYELQSNKIQEDNSSLLKIVFENVVENIINNGTSMESYKEACKSLSKHEQELFLSKVQMMIIIKYIKDFNGESYKLQKIYDEYYNSLVPERKEILDNMNKCTNNIVFKAMGMRATDNPTKFIRAGVKEALTSIYFD